MHTPHTGSGCFQLLVGVLCEESLHFHSSSIFYSDQKSDGNGSLSSCSNVGVISCATHCRFEYLSYTPSLIFSNGTLIEIRSAVICFCVPKRFFPSEGVIKICDIFPSIYACTFIPKKKLFSLLFWNQRFPSVSKMLGCRLSHSSDLIVNPRETETMLEFCLSLRYLKQGLHH